MFFIDFDWEFVVVEVCLDFSCLIFELIFVVFIEVDGCFCFFLYVEV